MTRVLLAAGGTGGHITPALATAAALRAAAPEVDVEFVGTDRGLESRLVPAAGHHLHTVAALPIRRSLNPGAVLANLRVPLVVLRSAADLQRLIAQRDVQVAATFGGYVSGPLAYAAKRRRLPLLLHEQNAVPGLANRIASRWATAVAISVPVAREGFPRGARVELTGNPVRPDLARAHLPALRAEACAAFGLDPSRRTLLIFGGSLGAARLNDAAVQSALRWRSPHRWQLLHITGGRHRAQAAAAWERALAPGAAASERLLVRTVGFVDRMDLAYAAADLVVCRAGASTIAEVTALGLPSLLVPYPHGAADEQIANARALQDAGAALMLRDEEVDGGRLVAVAEPLLEDDGQRAHMAAAARTLGKPEAAATLAGLLLELLEQGPPGRMT